MAQYIQYVLPSDIEDRYEGNKSRMCVTHQEFVSCMIGYCIENFSKSMIQWIWENRDPSPHGKNVQIKIHDEYKTWIKEAATGSRTQKSIIDGIIRFTLTQEKTDFIDYLLENTDDPDYEPGTAIIKSDNDTRALVEDQMGVDKFMEMGREQAQRESRREIEDLGTSSDNED